MDVCIHSITSYLDDSIAGTSYLDDSIAGIPLYRPRIFHCLLILTYLLQLLWQSLLITDAHIVRLSFNLQ